MPYQVSMMGWVGSGEDFCGLGWVQKFSVGLGFEKVTNDQLWHVVAGLENKFKKIFHLCFFGRTDFPLAFSKTTDLRRTS